MSASAHRITLARLIRNETSSPRFAQLEAVAGGREALGSSFSPRRLAGASALGALALGATFLGVAAYLGHRITRPGRAEVIASVPIGDDLEEVSFQTDDDLVLRGWYLGTHEPRDAIVICHGFGMERRELLALALGLRARDHAVLLFDFRGHGLSGGSRSTVGYLEAGDIIAAVGYLREREELQGRRVGVAGLSMGAAAAILACGNYAEIEAVVADSSFATLRDIAARGLQLLYGIPPVPFAPFVVRFGELFTRTRIGLNRPIDAVATIAPRPLLLIHGADDQLVPPCDALKLYAAAGEPKELWLATGVDHAGTFHSDEKGYIARLDAFFAHWLRAESPPGASA